MTEISFAELHSPLFHAGRNHGTKLETDKRPDLKLEYDEDKKELRVLYNHRVSRLPCTSVHSMEEKASIVKADVKPVINEHRTEDKSKRSSAQVSTPTSHVFK